MSRGQTSNDLPDADLQKLFRHQGTTASPTDLDQRILSAASQSVKEDTHVGDFAESDKKSWHTGIALIALLVVSLSLVPMLYEYQSSSETTRQSRAIVSGRIAAPQAEMSANKAAAPAADAGNSAISRQTPTAEKPAAAPSVSAYSSSIKSRALAAPEAAIAEETITEEGNFAFRRDPELWLAEIARLEKHGEAGKSTFEKKLFDSVHPDYSAQ